MIRPRAQRRPPEWRVEILAGADLPYFQGHFPNTPVLPGVVQLHWAIAHYRQLSGDTRGVTRIERLKFMHIIAPDSRVQLALWRSDPDCVEFSVSVHGTRCAEGAWRLGSRE